MESSLAKVDELMHISRRMRAIALQSAVGGMLLSVAGMIAAALGLRCPRLFLAERHHAGNLSTSLPFPTPCADRAIAPKDLTDF